MKQRLLLAVIGLLLASCQLFASQVAEKTLLPAEPSETPAASAAPSTLPSSTPTQRQETNTEPTAAIASATADPTGQEQPAAPTPTGELKPNELSIDYAQEFAEVEHPTWQAKGYRSELDKLPIRLDSVANPGVIAGLTDAHRAALSENGFTVLPTGEEQFADLRDQVSEEYGQPYYLTTDAAYHALHVTFNELLKMLERDVFRAQMIKVTQAMLDQVLAYPTENAALERDKQLAAAYLGVALRLFDPQAELPAGVESQSQPQIEQILAGGGQANSVLIPDFKDDYGAYKPVGHYAGDPDLENYFRGMTWYGRVSFKFRDPTDSQFQPSRAPLILTLALREANEGQAARQWKTINETLNFLVGPSDDPGPTEVSMLMEQVYGGEASYTTLTDDVKWQTFLDHVDSLPAPQINSTFLTSSALMESTRDWRLMGQRFTFDAAILQNLVYDKVGTPEKQRKIPSGLDVMAVFGSPAAVAALETAGENQYANYTVQLEKLRSSAQQQEEAQWFSRFYTGWLYSFFPQVQVKDESYPPYMRTAAWQNKDLNTALGSWAELKHDTVLYSKMPEFWGGGGPPSSGPAPAYVEPNPEVFYRMAYITDLLHEGLTYRYLIELGDSARADGLTLNDLMLNLDGLGARYKNLGAIAEKELAGEALNEDDYYTIQSCLGIVECAPTSFPETPPVPVVAAVSGAEELVLEVGVGKIDRIYVVVPINGELQVAQGGVFSYYEFTQPRSDRLTDEEWQQRLSTGTVKRPDWTGSFLIAGGEPTDVVAFRIGDWYVITEEGGNPPLNVRAQPSKTGQVLHRLEFGAYIEIIDGPVSDNGARWWKVRDDFEGIEGWVMENPAWYVRAHGQ